MQIELKLNKFVQNDSRYSIFLFLWQLTTKFSSEVGCEEVTNPKQPVRERDRQSPTALHVTTCASMLRWGQCYFIATQQFAERSELGKFLATMSNFRRHHQVVYCLIGQRRFNLTPLPLDSMRAARHKTRNSLQHIVEF